MAWKSILGGDEDGSCFGFGFGKSAVVVVDVAADDGGDGIGLVGMKGVGDGVGVVRGREGCWGCCYGTGSGQKRCHHTLDAVGCCGIGDDAVDVVVGAEEHQD